MSNAVHVANISPENRGHLALHRAAIAESGIAITEGPAWRCEVVGAVGLWAPAGLDLQPYRDALERAVWVANEQTP